MQMSGRGHTQVSLHSTPARWHVQVRYLAVGRNSRTRPRMLQTSVSGPRRDCAIAYESEVLVSKQTGAAFCLNWFFQCLLGEMQQQCIS